MKEEWPIEARLAIHAGEEEARIHQKNAYMDSLTAAHNRLLRAAKIAAHHVEYGSRCWEMLQAAIIKSEDLMQ